MPFQLAEITTSKDFGPVVPLEWDAYESPVNALWEILKGESIEECTGRQWWLHENTPGSRWIKITDTETGKIVGAANWIFHKENPFAKPSPPPQISWWSSPEMQDIAGQIMAKFYGPNPTMMNRPHAVLNCLFVDKDSYRRGIGKKMTEWGLRKADEMGLESFLQSSPMGANLYPAFGFVTVGHLYLSAENKNPTSTWTALYEKIVPAPFRVDIMWRPLNGKFELGKTEYSWKKKQIANEAPQFVEV